ncbi:aminoglycoside phosphotransferase family protein [Actinosynnema sp. NPDC050436]|uniref:aminoglycoside phosphotransferase family protein n=1 Tax=Actinosynnema sp. NPDC050436 TaxID=3155659 RepID=UPI0033E41953
MRFEERPIPEPLVRLLLAESFPRWADLPLRRVASFGTDHVMYRLGGDMVVRLPKVDWAVEGVRHENRWLPELAPHLPVPVPEPLGLGRPAAGYPWPWAVHRWLEGANPEEVGEPRAFAEDVAAFIAAMRRVRLPGAPTTRRGDPLATRDEATRRAIADIADQVDVAGVTRAWETALAAPAWDGDPVWLHGDLSPGNVLVRDGRFGAVIDFSLSGVGDPAADLVVAWNLVPEEGRQALREALGDDDATWERGQGLALSIALVQLQYWEHNPLLAGNSRHIIDQVMADAA